MTEKTIPEDPATSTGFTETSPNTPESSFSGYTLADIRYNRALVALQKQFCHEKIIVGMHKIQAVNPFGRDGSSSRNAVSRFSPIAGKLLAGLNYVDYALIGFSVFKTLRKGFMFFSRKK